MKSRQSIRIIMLGDVVGRPGRKFIKEVLSGLKNDRAIDLAVINGENASGGNGIQESAMKELFSAGIDVITSGNHVWHKKETYSLLKENERLLRPANYPTKMPGKGSCVVTLDKTGVKVGIINIIGRTFMSPIDNPFESVIKEISAVSQLADIIIVDFHAEATAEKEAMAFYLRDKASLLVGTHTHVQTSDEKIFPEGLGYITDLGRCGSFFSVLGFDFNDSLKGFLTSVPQSYTPDKHTLAIEGIIADIDTKTKKTVKIERIRIFQEAGHE